MVKGAVVAVASFIVGFGITTLATYGDFSGLLQSPPPSPSLTPSPAASPSALGQSNSLTFGPASDAIGGTVLVVAAHEEPLDWLQDQPFQPVVMVKGRPAGTPNNIPDNYGREAASYLQFIIEHYDNLPPRMIFVHGHNTSWHLKDIVGALNAIDPLSYEYATFSNMFMCFRADFVTMDNCWKDGKLDQWFGPLPVEPLDPYVGALCCATFLVTKERVLLRAKEVYEGLFKWVMQRTMHDSLTGRCMEWSWHFVFGQPWRSYAIDPTILCPSNPKPCSLENVNQANS